MQENSRNIKAKNIRSVIRYIQKFKNAVIVIYLDDEIIESPYFSGHIRDISLIHEAGIKVIIVPGSRNHIDKILSESNIKWKYINNIRITNDDAMPLIKMAAFDTSNIVMTSLAANHITAIVGNWVHARSKGVIDGIDYNTAGEIDNLQINAINTVLDNGFIPIFPCIGWSSTGKPYNISSINLAEEIAISMKADKLFFIMKNAEINNNNFIIPENIGLTEEFEVPAMNLEELDDFLKFNCNSTYTNTINLLKSASKACSNGVTRTHILNGSLEGVLPCEIFSDLGSGTMIYLSDYGKIRPMQQQDIPSVLSVMRPFIEKKILLPRSYESLLNSINDYIVFELDGEVRACASLHIYPDKQAEISGVAVDEAFSNLGIGPKLINKLIETAKCNKFSDLFLLTTQTGDFFEKLGFTQSTVDSLPIERKAIWTPERNSKVLRLHLL